MSAIMASYETYKLANMMCDVFASVLFVIMLLSLVRRYTYSDKLLKASFIMCLTFGLMSAITDGLVWILAMKTEYSMLFKAFSYINCIVLFFIPFAKAQFILRFAPARNNVSRVVRIIIMIQYSALFIALLVLLFAGQYLSFSAERNEIIYGPIYIIVSDAYMYAPFTVILYLILHYKSLGLSETILLCALQLSQQISYLWLWQEEGPTLVFYALLLLCIYLIIIKKRIHLLFQHNLELAQKQLELKDMKTKVVLSQVKPHFMYNALSTIAYLCKSDPEQAQKLTKNFASYLRTNIDSLDMGSCVSFNEELDHTKNYLAIEKTRFRERINIEYDIHVTEFTMPILSLQPIVENAVKHGICKKVEGGTIVISTHIEDSCYVVSVKDNGVGFDLDGVEEDGKIHIGLNNVKERVSSICNGYLDVKSEIGVGTTVSIFIPMEV